MITYGEVCKELSDWFRESDIDLSPDQVFDLDKTFPALMLGTLIEHKKKFDATTVCVSDEYVAEKVWKMLNG